MTKGDILIAVAFILLALLILGTNKLARAVVRETITHPFRRVKIRIKPQSGEVEVEPDDTQLPRVAPA
jgi:hypothetical protein